MIDVDGKKFTATPAFEVYWHYAAERQRIYNRRLRGEPAPWTEDPILNKYRFTNVFRASDRVSQYLIREVLYPYGDYLISLTLNDVLFRCILFRVFNRIDTWEALKEAGITFRYADYSFHDYNKALTQLKESGKSIYTSVYMLSVPKYIPTARYKHSQHLKMIEHAMEHMKNMPFDTLKDVQEALLDTPHIGRFLSYQIAIDCNYSDALHFNENEFVVAGPGALRGIKKAFPEAKTRDAEAIIRHMVDFQRAYFDQYEEKFEPLGGKRWMTLIDAQNVFCELDKYLREYAPEMNQGTSTHPYNTIKNKYKVNTEPLPAPWFPPKWKLGVQ